MAPLFSGMESPPTTWRYGQPWLPKTEPAFAPGRVAFGLSEYELVIRAELERAGAVSLLRPVRLSLT